MKRKIATTFFVLTAAIFSSGRLHGQGMSVNTTGAAADASAMLDVSSGTQGILVPRMTSTQRSSSISNPATGLLVYQTDAPSGFYYNSGTPSTPVWVMINALANVTTQGNAFNSASQLVQLDGSSQLPAVSGANLTSINATNISSGTLNANRLPTTVTTLGNTFNGASQLVQTTAGGLLPVISGANLTDLNGANLTANSVTIAKLPSGASASTFLRGDGTWATPGSSGGKAFMFSARVTNPNSLSTFYYSLNWTGIENHVAGAVGAGTIMASDCTFKALYVGATCRSSPAANSITVKLFKNGVDQGMGLTWAAPTVVGTTTKSSTTSNNFSVVAGDIVSLQFSQTNSAPIIDINMSTLCE